MSNGMRHDLIFSHEGNARAAASVILIGVVAVLIGSVFMAIGPRFTPEPRPARDAYIGGASAPVRVIGYAPRGNGPCEQQVWPNIDQRCLVRTEPRVNSDSAFSPAQNDKLSPLTTTATTMDRHSPSQDTTNGSTPYYATAPAPSQQDVLNEIRPSNVAVGVSSDSADELRQQEPIEPRKRARRYNRPFHLHFGAFRF